MHELEALELLELEVELVVVGAIGVAVAKVAASKDSLDWTLAIETKGWAKTLAEVDRANLESLSSGGNNSARCASSYSSRSRATSSSRLLGSIVTIGIVAKAREESGVASLLNLLSRIGIGIVIIFGSRVVVNTRNIGDKYIGKRNLAINNCVQIVALLLRL